MPRNTLFMGGFPWSSTSSIHGDQPGPFFENYQIQQKTSGSGQGAPQEVDIGPDDYNISCKADLVVLNLLAFACQ